MYSLISAEACPEGSFICQNGTCISDKEVCNCNCDCWNCEDESDCDEICLPCEYI